MRSNAILESLDKYRRFSTATIGNMISSPAFGTVAENAPMNSCNVSIYDRNRSCLAIGHPRCVCHPAVIFPRRF